MSQEEFTTASAEQLEQCFVFEIEQLAGVDIGAFDAFLSGNADLWASADGSEVRQELIELREATHSAYMSGDIKLAVANAKAMRWLYEYAEFRWEAWPLAENAKKSLQNLRSGRAEGKPTPEEIQRVRSESSSDKVAAGKLGISVKTVQRNKAK